MSVRLIALSLLCLALGCAAPAAKAQDVDRIAAVVNDDMISIHDLESRLKLALVMSNLPDNLENRRRAVPQVLRKMVDERLQLQEAARVKIVVPAEDINRSIANIERQNKMPPGGLLGYLSKAGVDGDAVRDQIRADITWMRVVTRVLAGNIKVGEDEITERLDVLRQQLGKPEYLLAEIFLNVDTPAQEEEARRLGERLLDQLKSGAPFQALARQFSQAASAGSGGMLGWVNDVALDDEIRNSVSGLNKGEVSPLTRVATGYNIVAVLDKRISGAQASNDETMTVVQVFFPNPIAGSVNQGQLRAKAAELTAPIKTCRDFEDFGRKLGSEKAGRLENGRKSELPPQVRAAVGELPVNTASAPQETEGGYLVYMVCSRTALGADGGLPSRETLRRQVEDERLELQGKRYLRDLRRAAFVDFRL